MTLEDEDRLYGPRPELIGRVGLQQHDVLRGAEQNAPDAVALGNGASVLVKGRCNGLKRGGSLGGRKMSAHRLGEIGAQPPELLHRQVGGTHVFVVHGALAVVKGKRVWAVTPAGVEVLK